MIFGNLTGYRFLSFRMLSWVWAKSEGGKITFSKSSRFAGILGQCLMAPNEDEGSFHYILYNLGGGIANLVFAAFFLFLAIITKNNLLFSALFGLSLAPLLLGITNLIPLIAGGLPNDGRNIKEASSSPLAKHAFYLMLYSSALMASGKLIKDFDDSLLLTPNDADTQNYLVANLILLRAAQLEDQGLINDSFEQLIRVNYKKLPGFYEAEFIFALLFFYLVYFGDEGSIQKAQTILNEKSNDKIFLKLLNTEHPSFMPFLAAKAAFLDKDNAKALRLIEKTRKLLPTLMNPGQEYSIELTLKRLEDKMKTQNPL